MTPKPLNNEGSIEEATQKTVDYLYPIKGNTSPELTEAVAMLRQLINEEFVAKGKTVSSQFIYDIIHPAINKAVIEARIDELHRQYGWQIESYADDHYYPKRIAELKKEIKEDK